MKLKVKDVDIQSGGVFVSILNEEDARHLDLFALDRIRIKHNKKEIITIVDIAESKKAVPKGSIGLFEEVLKELNVHGKEIVDIYLADKPHSTTLIKEKLDGKELNENEIDIIVKDIVNNNLSEIELTFFVAACYSKGLTDKEALFLTKSIAKNGTMLDLKRKLILDKHCSGGVPGNRTTMIIVPIIAAAGYTIPKSSSRAISSPAGTADTVEVLTNVTLPKDKIEKVVRKTNGCMIWGGGMHLASADDRMIKVRYSLNLDPAGLLLSSILAKKVAVGANHLLVDIPVGPATKIKTMRQAENLKTKFVSMCSRLGIKVKVILTDGSQPIGKGIGPLLEARDVIWVLENDRRAPHDLRDKSITMAGMLLEMAGEKDGKAKALEILKSGKAFKKFCEIVKAQGGRIRSTDKLKPAKYFIDIVSEKKGKVHYIDCKSISKIARLAGAPKTQSAGIYLYKQVGDDVLKGETLFTIYSESKEKLKQAEEAFAQLNGFVVA